MATTLKVSFADDTAWEQRAGRKATPVAPHILNAVTKAHSEGKVGVVDIPDEAERKALISQLRKAGRQAGLTVLIQTDETVVRFKVTDKVSRPRKPKAQPESAAA